METPVGRTRINFAQDAKSFVKLDITTEYATPEESAKMMGEAIDVARQTAKDKGLKMLEAIEK